jgi:hypothetical protein
MSSCPSSRTEKRDLREELRLSDTDVGVRSNKVLLGLADVGPPLYFLRERLHRLHAVLNALGLSSIRLRLRVIVFLCAFKSVREGQPTTRPVSCST